MLPDKEADERLRKLLATPHSTYLPGGEHIERHIVADGPPRRLNVVVLLEESLGAEFVGAYGDKRGLSPVTLILTVGIEAFQLLCRIEGIIPALEPSHAIAAVMKRAPAMAKDKIIVVNLCGRGDKDIFTVADALGVKL